VCGRCSTRRGGTCPVSSGQPVEAVDRLEDLGEEVALGRRL
jgi:hypothetical protein